MIINTLKKIGTDYQDVLEKYFENYPVGTCYLSGYILSNFFKKLNYDAKCISGSLAIMDKNEKYFIYGSLTVKGQKVGHYHTWCEVLVYGNRYVIDPSIKYNKIYLKQTINFKAYNKVEDVIVTTEKNTYAWKYEQNDSYIVKSDEFLFLVSDSTKNKLLDSMIEKYNGLIF